MTTTLTSEAPRRTAGRFGARHPLATPRALLGAALVAAAVVGTFVAAGGGTPPPPPPRVVAARSIAPGERLTTDHLATAAVELGPADAGAFDDPAHLVGATALAPLAAGELVQASAVALPDQTAPDVPTGRLTLRLAADRALGGRLQPGEAVDVVATLGTGAEAETAVVARHVPVVRTDQLEDGVGGTTVVLTLAPADEEEAVDLVHAAEVGAVVLVRPGVGTR